MPTWIVPESALQTLEILAGKRDGMRLDELRALVSMKLVVGVVDTMAARRWITRDGDHALLVRLRITSLGRDALAYGRAERASR